MANTKSDILEPKSNWPLLEKRRKKLEAVESGRSRWCGDYTPKPKPRKEKRKAQKAARKINRSAYHG